MAMMTDMRLLLSRPSSDVGLQWYESMAEVALCFQSGHDLLGSLGVVVNQKQFDMHLVLSAHVQTQTSRLGSLCDLLPHARDASYGARPEVPMKWYQSPAIVSAS